MKLEILFKFPMVGAKIRNYVIRKEGGEKTSKTLRRYMQEKYNITDAELEIMQVLWKKKQCNLTTIIEELSNNEEKNKNTIKTLIHRLVQKGAIESRKVNTKEVVYIPKINEKKFLSKESNSFLKKFFNGSTERLLLNFVENKKVSKDELKRLIDVLKQDED